MSFIPSLFTILNLFCGFMSVVNSSNGDTLHASLFILYAAFFDVFDGFVARFTRTSSRFGVELDSLADIVSFGVAPSFVLYTAYFRVHDGFGIALASLIMIFTALRLARFNIQLSGFDKSHFSGVPAPISAVTVASFFMFYFDKNFNHHTSELFAYSLAIGLPVLMITRFKYDTFPKFSLSAVKSQPVKYIFIVIIVFLLVFSKGEGLFAFCLFYLSTGIFRGIKNQVRKIFSGRKTDGETEEKLKFKSTS